MRKEESTSPNSKPPVHCSDPPKTKHRKKRSHVIFEDIKKTEDEIEQLKEERSAADNNFQY